jgi:DNA-binding transcriptional MerR regulator
MDAIGLRIGELSRRLGVPAETLRAWERRYGVLRPARTAAGYRLYGEADERRARRMRRLIADGWAAREAAASALADGEHGSGDALPGIDDLLDPLLRFDATAGGAAFDRLLGTRPLDQALRDVVLPAMREVGTRWSHGDLSIAAEHFATAFVTARLHALAHQWDRGDGPRALLACPAGERHVVGLLACALVLRSRGWRVSYLGADTPVEALADAAAVVAPDVLVLAILRPQVLERTLAGLEPLVGRTRIAAGGAGTSAAALAGTGVEHLPGDPVEAAASLAAA